jgi:hypothetical protein
MNQCRPNQFTDQENKRPSTMGSQNVPGMAVLQLHCRTYGNIFLMTFKAGPLRARIHTTHTHTHNCSIYSVIAGSTMGAEGFFWNLPEFGRRNQLKWLRNVSYGGHFQSREQPKVTRSDIRRVRWLRDDRNCCTTSDVWLGALSWCRNHCPCLPLVAPLPPNCITQPLQNLHCPGGTNSCTKPSMSTNSGNFLTAASVLVLLNQAKWLA